MNIQPKNPNPIKQTENSNQIRDAQQFHQNTWQQIQPQPQRQPVRQAQQQNNTPPPRQQQNRQTVQPARQNIQTPPMNKKK